MRFIKLFNLKMKKIFQVSLLTFILTLTLVYRSHGFKFSITRDLDDSKPLDKQFWTNIEILEDCEEGPSRNVSFKVNTPSVLASKDRNFTIFFANDKYNVLEVHLINSMTEGMYYTTPYRLERRMKGPETSRIDNDDITEISGMFPMSWLPSNCTLVSGSLSLGDGRYYNYYNLKNFKVSIPDLKVLEEYKKYESCS